MLEPQLPTSTFACTSLSVADQNGNIYHGRTLEYKESGFKTTFNYFPQQHKFQHYAPDHSFGLSYSSQYAVMALIMHQQDTDLWVEGVNTAGLSFSVNMYHHHGLKSLEKSYYSDSIPYEDLGKWALNHFSSITALRQGLETLHVWSDMLEVLGLNSPFHFAFYDQKGGCIVVEIKDGQLIIYDNPTGVMTNGPEFPWHLTNLNNYTHLTNIDVPAIRIGALDLQQPDSGIATQGIPASNTSVGRFVKAFYYASYVNRVEDPDEQLVELSHIMNNFDRPKNMNIVLRLQDGQPVMVREHTVWTSLTDLSRGQLYIRNYTQLNYTRYSFQDFAALTTAYSVSIN